VLVLLIGIEEKLTPSHRSQIDIVADVLRETASGAKKTHIMYSCNLSFRQLQTYLNLLLDRGLLRKISEKGKSRDPRFFKTTNKGQNLLQAYDRLKALMTA
jgi:predicted transcriptional regulator